MRVSYLLSNRACRHVTEHVVWRVCAPSGQPAEVTFQTSTSGGDARRTRCTLTLPSVAAYLGHPSAGHCQRPLILRSMAMSSAGHDALHSSFCQPAEQGVTGPQPAPSVPARKPTCDAEQFFQLDLRAGTILTAKLNPRARQPAYVLTISLGPLGTVISSAQLVANYAAEDLVGRRVVVVANLPPRKIAGVKSEVLVLGTMSSDQGTLLLSPDDRAADGAPVG